MLRRARALSLASLPLFLPGCGQPSSDADLASDSDASSVGDSSVGKADGAEDTEVVAYRWTNLERPTGPWNRYGNTTMLIYDTRQDQVIGVGPTSRTDQGIIVGAYDREQNAWSTLHDWQGGPGWIQDFALTYDESNGRILLFGGENSSQTILDGLWIFEAGAWTHSAAPNGPSARIGATMVYDPQRESTLLYGGYGSDGWLSDLWSFDGSWQRLSDGAGGPSARGFAALAYDPVRDRVILSGGQDGPGRWTYDTWEWDGNGWESALQRTLAYRRGALLFDPALAETVGLGSGTMERFDGSRVLALDTLDSRAPTLALGRAVYDEAGEQIFVFTSGVPKVARLVEENLAPVFDNTRSEASVAVTRPLEVPVAAHDPEGIHVEVDVTGLPEGARFDGRAIVWTPSYEDVGTYQLSATATDGVSTVEHAITIEVFETTYDFLPMGDLDFTADVGGISCTRSVDAGPPSYIVEKHGSGSVECTLRGRNPGLIVVECTADVPVLIATQWGYTADAVRGLRGESALSSRGFASIFDEDDNGNSSLPMRGEISLGLQSSGNTYQASASVRYDNWADEQRTWTNQPGVAVVNVE